MAERDKNGRFVKGHENVSPGRPPNAAKSLVAALKERLDPDEMADELLRRAKNSDALLMYLFNRIEGMPKQSTENTHEHKVEQLVRYVEGN